MVLENIIMNETLNFSPMKNPKSRNFALPEAVMPSNSKYEKPRLHRRKRTNPCPGVLRAGGHAKDFRRNSNQFPSAASKPERLTGRRGRAGSHGSE